MDDGMKITIKNNSVNQTYFALTLQRYIDVYTRFTARVDVITSKSIKIRNIRLKESRKYCGNHPNACELNAGPSRSAKYLEGADWVYFNDMINDLCDALYVDATISTAVCKVRKGKLRRIYYGSHMHGFNWQWNMDEPDDCYAIFDEGEPAPNSEFPYGTPGIYERDNNWTQEISRIHYENKYANQKHSWQQ